MKKLTALAVATAFMLPLADFAFAQRACNPKNPNGGLCNGVCYQDLSQSPCAKQPAKDKQQQPKNK